LRDGSRNPSEQPSFWRWILPPIPVPAELHGTWAALACAVPGAVTSSPPFLAVPRRS